MLGEFRALGEQGQPEVHYGHVALVVDDKVARFDVAMDDAFFVRGLEAFPDLLGDVEDVGNLQGRGFDAFVEAFAFDEGHREKRLLVDLRDLINGANVRVMESRGSLGLPMKAFIRFLVLQQVRSEEFERDRAVELRVLGFVDHAHAALAELGGDLVMSDGLVDHRRFRTACGDCSA